MDGIGDIIVLLLVLLSFVIGAIGKFRKSVASSPLPEYNQPNSSKPSQAFSEEEDEEYDKEEEKNIRLSNFLREVSDAKRVAEITTPATPLRGKKTAPEQAVAVDAYSPADANELSDEFDLRQAVIYSEILKPKFEE